MRQQIFRNPLATFMKRSNLYRLKPRHASPNRIRRYADVPLCAPLSSGSFFCVFLSLPVLMRFICFKKGPRVFFRTLAICSGNVPSQNIFKCTTFFFFFKRLITAAVHFHHHHIAIPGHNNQIRYFQRTYLRICTIYMIICTRYNT